MSSKSLDLSLGRDTIPTGLAFSGELIEAKYSTIEDDASICVVQIPVNDLFNCNTSDCWRAVQSTIAKLRVTWGVLRQVFVVIRAADCLVVRRYPRLMKIPRLPIPQLVPESRPMPLQSPSLLI